MCNVTIKISLYLLVGISAVAWFSLAYFGGLDLSKVKDFFGLVLKVVTIDLLIVAAFVKWGWKFSIFRGWLVPFPNLNGTWAGLFIQIGKTQRLAKNLLLYLSCSLLTSHFFILAA